MDMTKLVDLYQDALDRLSTRNGVIALIGTGVLLSAGTYLALKPSEKGRPSSLGLKGGELKGRGVKEAFNDYSASYGGEGKEYGIKQQEETPQLVASFYNLVTDFYEWGWGLSFHFSPLLPSKGLVASEVAHETRIGSLLRLKPGMKCADFGCGVGGPMRIVAATTGAEIVGITVNAYQVDRCRAHNERMGFSSLCHVEQGDFLKLKHADNSFDAGYAVEATCHAPKVEEAYAEIMRVLKPGALFLTYEWVATPLFDSSNKEHARIINDIVYGNGLPTMRSAAQCIQAAKSVGFELLEEADLAISSPIAGPWYTKLDRINSTIWVNKAIVNTLSMIHCVPKGVKDVHEMLCHVAQSLVEGGKTGVFSPMHLILLRKPGPAAA